TISRLVICPWDQAWIISARFLRAFSASLIRAFSFDDKKNNATMSPPCRVGGERWGDRAPCQFNCSPCFPLCSPDSVRGLCLSFYMSGYFRKGDILSPKQGPGLSRMSEPYQSRGAHRAPTAALHGLLPSA